MTFCDRLKNNRIYSPFLFCSVFFVAGLLLLANHAIAEDSTPASLPELSFSSENLGDVVTLPYYNSGVTLTWLSKSADSCTASGDWKGSRALNGDYTIGRINSSQTYILSCTNNAGTTQRSVTINIFKGGSGPSVTVDLKVNGVDDDIIVEKGSSVMLGWSSEFARACSAIGDNWNGTQSAGGVRKISNLTKSTTFILVCFNSQGSHEESITVNVKEPEPAPPPPLAPKPEPKPSVCTPTTISGITIVRNLQKGAGGEDVKQLQQYLNKAGFTLTEDGPGSPGNETDYFGALTVNAVKSFQCSENIGCDNSLPEYGSVGFLTRKAFTRQRTIGCTISPISQSTLSAGSGQAHPSTQTITITRWMTIGTKGQDVKQLQQFLNQNNFTIANTGPGSSGQETTYYGSLTQKAIQKFQCAKNIVCEGTVNSTGYGAVGPRTRGVLRGN